MNEEPLRVVVVHCGVTTGRISSRLVNAIAELQLTKPVVVDFKEFEDRIKGISPEMMIIDDVEFRSSQHLDDVIEATKEASNQIPKPRNKPLPYYHGKRRF